MADFGHAYALGTRPTVCSVTPSVAVTVVVVVVAPLILITIHVVVVAALIQLAVDVAVVGPGIQRRPPARSGNQSW